MTTTNVLTRFGFKYEKGGAHIARTMMLDELRALLRFFAQRKKAAKRRIQGCPIQSKLPCKRFWKNRILTYRHLVDLTH
jgi:hypothetical protein